MEGLARAARQAIAEIRERSGGSPGPASLTSTGAGQLPLADARNGQSRSPATARAAMAAPGRAETAMAAATP